MQFVNSAYLLRMVIFATMNLYTKDWISGMLIQVVENIHTKQYHEEAAYRYIHRSANSTQTLLWI
jgi:hypothetical protein